jgi:hypothetical protein
MPEFLDEPTLLSRRGVMKVGLVRQYGFSGHRRA